MHVHLHLREGIWASQQLYRREKDRFEFPGFLLTLGRCFFFIFQLNGELYVVCFY
jgi:hypothetical protein